MKEVIRRECSTTSPQDFTKQRNERICGDSDYEVKDNILVQSIWPSSQVDRQTMTGAESLVHTLIAASGARAEFIEKHSQAFQ